MQRSSMARYISVPAFVAIGAFLYGLNRQPFSLEMLISALLGGFLFYAAPFLIWTLIVLAADFSGPVGHAGFIAPSIALILIAFLSLFVRGLPIQWLLYWPLAIVLQFVAVTTAVLYVRRRSRVDA